MKDFNYYAPTEVVFGENSEEQVAALVKKYGGTKVLVHYGGKSAERSGLLDKICGPNPRLSLVHEGIKLCREEGIDFILAVGGGSVIDSSKAIAYGVPYEGEVWDFYLGKDKATEMLPVACVLTIPAAGSEMSEASVITNEDGDVKLGYSNNLSRPKFAIMNPKRTFTLPPYQTAAGVTDMMMHTMERYFTKDDDMDLTTDIAEAMLRSMKDAIFAVLKNPEDYRYVTHGAGLAAIWPSWARYVMHENLSRFVRFAVNVMDVPNDFTDPEGTALKGIEAMERFYHAIGMPINIKELIGKDITDEEIKEMTRKCSRNYQHTCGQLKVLKAEDMENIYKMARG